MSTLPNLGGTRSAIERNHFLSTPETFVRIPLPGMKKALAIVHVSPAAGAAFTQYTAEMESGGELGPALGQRFVYVLDGVIEVKVQKSTMNIKSDGYAYLPASAEHTIASRGKSRIAVIEKIYKPLPDVAEASVLAGSERLTKSIALNGDKDLQVRALLPDTFEHDFAVNTMSYQPGAALSQVEIHVMEHGLLMLEGGGIYRLGDKWYPVTAGDFIWMAPYCPQWFGAIGKKPAKYLIYKDWNRHPLA